MVAAAFRGTNINERCQYLDVLPPVGATVTFADDFCTYVVDSAEWKFGADTTSRCEVIIALKSSGNAPG